MQSYGHNQVQLNSLGLISTKIIFTIQFYGTSAHLMKMGPQTLLFEKIMLTLPARPLQVGDRLHFWGSNYGPLKKDIPALSLKKIEWNGSGTNR